MSLYYVSLQKVAVNAARLKICDITHRFIKGTKDSNLDYQYNTIFIHKSSLSMIRKLGNSTKSKHDFVNMPHFLDARIPSIKNVFIKIQDNKHI